MKSIEAPKIPKRKEGWSFPESSEAREKFKTAFLKLIKSPIDSLKKRYLRIFANSIIYNYLDVFHHLMQEKRLSTKHLTSCCELILTRAIEEQSLDALKEARRYGIQMNLFKSDFMSVALKSK